MKQSTLGDPTDHESHSHGGAELARQLMFPSNVTGRSALHCQYCPAHHRNNHQGFRVINKCCFMGPHLQASLKLSRLHRSAKYCVQWCKTLGAGTWCVLLLPKALGLSCPCFACICFCHPSQSPYEPKNMHWRTSPSPSTTNYWCVDKSLVTCVQPSHLSTKYVAWGTEYVSVRVGNIWLYLRARYHHGGGPAAAAGHTIGAKDRDGGGSRNVEQGRYRTSDQRCAGRSWRHLIKQLLWSL